MKMKDLSTISLAKRKKCEPRCFISILHPSRTTLFNSNGTISLLADRPLNFHFHFTHLSNGFNSNGISVAECQ